MAMSIAHRATGIALYAGTVLLVLWLGAAAISQQALNPVNDLYGSWFGQIVLFGYTWAILHHMLGGIRHFIWDMGAVFGEEARNWLAKATIAGSVAITILLWIIGYMVR